MKKSLLFLIIITLLSSVQAQQSDAEIQLMKRTYTSSDKGIDIRVRKEIKLLRHKAMLDYAHNGESFIIYNPAIESVTINECYTRQADGTKVYPRERAFVNQLPESCEDCGRYNAIREMAIIHTGTELNCTIVLDYTLHRDGSCLVENIDMQQEYPVERYDIIVDGKTLRSEQNIPQRIYRRFERPNDQYVAKVRIGSLPNYAAETTLPEAQTVLGTLPQGNAKQRAESIASWVRDNIRCHKGLDLAHLNYQIAPAAVTLQSGCGTAPDLVALAAAMMRQDGIEATLLCDPDGDFADNPFSIEFASGAMRYTLTPQHPYAQLKDAARDQATMVHVDTVLTWNPQPLAQGYCQFDIPVDQYCIASQMPTSQVGETVLKPCDLDYRYTLALPKGTELMGGGFKIEYKTENIGQITFSVKQDGTTLLIERQLKLYHPFTKPEHYAALRQLIVDWSGHHTLLFKTN